MLRDCFRTEADESRAKDYRLDSLLQTPFWSRMRLSISGLKGHVVYNREQCILQYVKNNLIAADCWDKDFVRQMADILHQHDPGHGRSLLEWTAMGRPNLLLGLETISEKLRTVTGKDVSEQIDPAVFKIRVPTSSELDRIFR
jgi:hypothetical protein